MNLYSSPSDSVEVEVVEEGAAPSAARVQEAFRSALARAAEGASADKLTSVDMRYKVRPRVGHEG